MLLAIDIGNTNIKIGVWDGQNWLVQWRLRSVHEKTVDEYWTSLRTLLRELNSPNKVDRVVISSGVPPLTVTFTNLCLRYLNIDPLRISAESDHGIIIDTENPAEVGTDRIADAVGAVTMHSLPAIVIDMGTATTFDVILPADANWEKPRLAGVVIATGLRLSAEALAARAAQLSKVALQAPPQVLGRNTTHAVQSGQIFGYVCMIEGMVARLSAELGIDPIIIGTGGLISLIAPHTEIFDFVEPWLTLIGLKTIADRHANKTG